MHPEFKFELIVWKKYNLKKIYYRNNESAKTGFFWLKNRLKKSLFFGNSYFPHEFSGFYFFIRVKNMFYGRAEGKTGKFFMSMEKYGKRLRNFVFPHIVSLFYNETLSSENLVERKSYFSVLLSGKIYLEKFYEMLLKMLFYIHNYIPIYFYLC